MPRLARRSVLLALAAVVLLAGRIGAAEPAPEATLKVGDPAPVLAPTGWLNGEPVARFAAGTIYVVECWATWCGPCKAAIPHLSQLSTRFAGDRVVFIGLDVMERDPAAVAPFVAGMGARMNYRVALDGQGANAEAWLAAAGRSGIPCSFVVDRTGTLAWIGHPMDGLAEVLGELVAGTFDAKATAARQAERERRLAALSEHFRTAIDQGDVAAFRPVIAEAAAIAPELAEQVRAGAFRTLLGRKAYADARGMAQELQEGGNAEVLNAVAWDLLDTPGIPEGEGAPALALRLALRADQLTGHRDPRILDTVALARFANGDRDQAIACEQLAISLLEPGEDKAHYEAALQRFRAPPAP